MTATITEISQMLGLSVARCRQLEGDGVVIKMSAGRYDAITSTRNYIEGVRNRIKEPVNLPEGVASIEESKARKEAANASLAEIELAQARMQLMPIAEIDARDARIGGAIRMAVMKQRSELPPLLEGLSASQIAGIIDQHNRNMLDMLSDMQSEFWNRHEKLSEMKSTN